MFCDSFLQITADLCIGIFAIVDSLDTARIDVALNLLWRFDGQVIVEEVFYAVLLQEIELQVEIIIETVTWNR